MLKIQGIPFVQGQVVLEPMQLVTIAISLILIAIIVHAVLIRSIDFWKVPVQKATGTILEKIYRPGFVSEYPDGKGNTFNRCIGPTHLIKVKLSIDDESTTGIMIRQEVYDAIKEGDQVVIDFKRGRKTGNLRIMEVSLA